MARGADVSSSPWFSPSCRHRRGFCRRAGGQILPPIRCCCGGGTEESARREDIPYIRCQVCERIVREISAQVTKKEQALPPSKKVLEVEIIEIAKYVCNLKKQEADWMLWIDIVEKGKRLEGKVLKDKGSQQKYLKQQVVKQIKDRGKKIKRTCEQGIKGGKEIVAREEETFKIQQN
ncbi:hypothetical protein ABZP36_012315 [Zizania latifolia]